MTTTAPDSAARRRWVNGRVVLILLGLTALICASVMVTDVLSPRDRQLKGTTTTSLGRGGAAR
jgi:hypothetical protein